VTLAAALASLAAIAAAAAVFGLLDAAPGRRSSRAVAGRLRTRIAASGWSEAVASVLRRLAPRLPARALAAPHDLETRLTAAGRPLGLGASEWAASRWVCCISSAGAALVLTADASVRGRLVWSMAAGALGFAAPQLWLGRRIERRIATVRRELPDMLELLRVTVDAGQAPMRALGAVAAQFAGVVAAEWKRASAECALGAAEADALTALRLRLPCAEMDALCDALARSRRHGSPLGRVLGAQAERVRHEQRQRLRERAAKAGPKIQLAVALLMVPSVLLLVLAGLLAELRGSGIGFGP
jgi:tight adherence protein C